MITKISTRNFKRFGAQDFPLEALSLLAGPNNSGKSTLLQAAMVWNLAMQKWWEKKGPGSGSKAKDRPGAPITRQEFTALPLPSMDQLWTDTHTSLRKEEGKQGAPQPLVITLHGTKPDTSTWQLGFEFRYSGPEQIQKQLYDILRTRCHERKGQLLIATHSEVLIDSTSPDQILSFYREPHPLASETDRDQVREALKRVTSLELLLAENARGILYLEGTTDFDLLKAWADVLNHPLKAWFASLPFWHNNMGRNPKEARAHFFALKAIRPDLKAALLLDGDNRSLPERELVADGLTLLRWERYEAESYLLHPASLQRFLESEKGPLFAAPALSYLRQQLPPAFFMDPLATTPFLRAEPASKTLLPELLRLAEVPLSKSDYFLLAQATNPEELPREVWDKLTSIQDVVAP